ncbi:MULTISPECIES: McbB family protein [Pseudomonas syringae group]|uniref:McbB family protein n=1 Tax=Pseudomonas syringae group TaxID=136849 RepID=UPI00073A1A53|nr:MULTISPECIES: McbB family protein [Pseudomonas syringae group]KUG43841.1 hypothetical protein ALP79_200344 [Pseudomonas savastanoi pv. fraxini]KWS68545.1 McbB family protein [Pseudomonas savastanoi pv. fraxini]POC98094.1 McbB family protein [Pseudomonas amygdali pv. morsprunorum]POD36754.1 McbB family protein [Pseudomonas amygdali pv. morsprunorum]POD38376.1 McbB family protein [Pseudomonas amygdali pv. morsprunorum]
MYFIRPFGLTGGVGGTLLLAPHASVRVIEEKMIRFLTVLAGDKAQYFKKCELNASLRAAEIEPEKGVKFLQHTGILESASAHEEENRPFSTCALISDLGAATAALQSSLIADGVNISTLCTPDSIPNEAFQDRTLIVVALENYSSQVIRDIYDSCSNLNNIGFIQAYYFRHEFKIDGLFMPSIGSPCHFCHFERWRSRERRSFGNNKSSWHQVVELLSNHEKTIPPSIPLTDCDRHFSAQILRRRVQQLVGIPINRVHLDSFISAISADVIRCNVSSEPIPHWHSCSCTKGVW